MMEEPTTTINATASPHLPEDEKKEDDVTTTSLTTTTSPAKPKPLAAPKSRLPESRRSSLGAAPSSRLPGPRRSSLPSSRLTSPTKPAAAPTKTTSTVKTTTSSKPSSSVLASPLATTGSQITAPSSSLPSRTSLSSKLAAPSGSAVLASPRNSNNDTTSLDNNRPKQPVSEEESPLPSPPKPAPRKSLLAGPSTDLAAPKSRVSSLSSPTKEARQPEPAAWQEDPSGVVKESRLSSLPSPPKARKSLLAGPSSSLAAPQNTNSRSGLVSPTIKDAKPQTSKTVPTNNDPTTAKPSMLAVPSPRNSKGRTSLPMPSSNLRFGSPPATSSGASKLQRPAGSRKSLPAVKSAALKATADNTTSSATQQDTSTENIVPETDPLSPSQEQLEEEELSPKFGGAANDDNSPSSTTAPSEKADALHEEEKKQATSDGPGDTGGTDDPPIAKEEESAKNAALEKSQQTSLDDNILLSAANNDAATSEDGGKPAVNQELSQPPQASEDEQDNPDKPSQPAASDDSHVVVEPVEREADASKKSNDHDDSDSLSEKPHQESEATSVTTTADPGLAVVDEEGQLLPTTETVSEALPDPSCTNEASQSVLSASLKEEVTKAADVNKGSETANKESLRPNSDDEVPASSLASSGENEHRQTGPDMEQDTHGIDDSPLQKYENEGESTENVAAPSEEKEEKQDGVGDSNLREPSVFPKYTKAVSVSSIHGTSYVEQRSEGRATAPKGSPTAPSQQAPPASDSKRPTTGRSSSLMASPSPSRTSLGSGLRKPSTSRKSAGLVAPKSTPSRLSKRITVGHLQGQEGDSDAGKMNEGPEQQNKRESTSVTTAKASEPTSSGAGDVNLDTSTMTAETQTAIVSPKSSKLAVPKRTGSAMANPRPSRIGGGGGGAASPRSTAPSGAAHSTSAENVSPRSVAGRKVNAAAAVTSPRNSTPVSTTKKSMATPSPSRIGGASRSGSASAPLSATKISSPSTVADAIATRAVASPSPSRIGGGLASPRKATQSASSKKASTSPIASPRGGVGSSGIASPNMTGKAISPVSKEKTATSIGEPTEANEDLTGVLSGATKVDAELSDPKPMVSPKITASAPSTTVSTVAARTPPRSASGLIPPNRTPAKGGRMSSPSPNRITGRISAPSAGRSSLGGIPAPQSSNKKRVAPRSSIGSGIPSTPNSKTLPRSWQPVKVEADETPKRAEDTTVSTSSLVSNFALLESAASQLDHQDPSPTVTVATSKSFSPRPPSTPPRHPTSYATPPPKSSSQQPIILTQNSSDVEDLRSPAVSRHNSWTPKNPVATPLATPADALSSEVAVATPAQPALSPDEHPGVDGVSRKTADSTSSVDERTPSGASAVVDPAPPKLSPPGGDVVVDKTADSTSDGSADESIGEVNLSAAPSLRDTNEISKEDEQIAIPAVIEAAADLVGAKERRPDDAEPDTESVDQMPSSPVMSDWDKTTATLTALHMTPSHSSDGDDELRKESKLQPPPNTPSRRDNRTTLNVDDANPLPPTATTLVVEHNECCTIS